MIMAKKPKFTLQCVKGGEPISYTGCEWFAYFTITAQTELTGYTFGIPHTWDQEGWTQDDEVASDIIVFNKSYYDNKNLCSMQFQFTSGRETIISYNGKPTRFEETLTNQNKSFTFKFTLSAEGNYALKERQTVEIVVGLYNRSERSIIVRKVRIETLKGGSITII